jgi:hypothetical protein
MTRDSEDFVWVPSHPDRRPLVGIAIATLAICSAAILSGPPGPLGLHAAQSITRSLESGVAKKAARAADASGRSYVTPAYAQKAVIRRPGVGKWAAPALLGKAKPTKAKLRSAKTKATPVMPWTRAFLKSGCAQERLAATPFSSTNVPDSKRTCPTAGLLVIPTRTKVADDITKRVAVRLRQLQ